MGMPPFLLSGPILSTGYDWGTPLDWFDLVQALAPGMSENTRLKQIAKALAYWQAIVAANVADSLTMLKANTAVGWLTTEQARVLNPPPNSLHIVYPV